MRGMLRKEGSNEARYRRHRIPIHDSIVSTQQNIGANGGGDGGWDGKHGGHPSLRPRGGTTYKRGQTQTETQTDRGVTRFLCRCIHTDVSPSSPHHVTTDRNSHVCNVIEHCCCFKIERSRSGCGAQRQNGDALDVYAAAAAGRSSAGDPIGDIIIQDIDWQATAGNTIQQNIAGIIIHLADDFDLLKLRGGGPGGITQGGRRECRTLGGGVADFLDSDSEVEAWEFAELERRRQEEILRPSPPNKPDLYPIVYGEREGVRTVVCSRCARDIPVANEQWWRCRCGRGQCAACPICPCGAELSLLHETPMPVEADPESGPLCTWGGGDALSPHPNMQAEEIPGEPPHGGDGSTTCFACGENLRAPGSEWRICRCTLFFCIACAKGPCDGCGAEIVHDDPHPSEEEHPTPEPALSDGGMTEGEEDHAGPNDAYVQEPMVLTPANALSRREQMMAEEASRKTVARAESRRLRCEQVKQGRRLARRSEKRDMISIVTANVTAVEAWRSEMQHGQLLKNADFTVIQEHRLGPAALGAAADALRDMGCDSVIQEAYWKELDYGGGTAITARQWSGVRPLALSQHAGEKPHPLRGRFVSGVVDIYGGILLGSVYGISGLDAKHQLDIWHDIALHVRTHGLPFILAGDWQVPPATLQASGLPGLLGAQVFATSTPTNVCTGRVLDYFLVSKSVSDMVIEVKAIVGTRLATHLPVELTLKGRRSLGEAMRVARPPTLDVFPPPPTSCCWSPH